MKAELNVLLADDNADDVYLFQQAFKRAGANARLLIVADGVEVLAYLKGEGVYGDRKAHPFPDVLLLDLNMPRLNGFEVLSWVRNDPQCKRVMVHILTASCDSEDSKRAYDLNVNTFVLKPSRLEELVELARAFHAWHRFVVLSPPPENRRPVVFTPIP
jgi:CheY-like chemotaxis protein